MRARLFTILHNFHWQNLRSQSHRPAPASLTDELAGRISRAGDQDDRLALGDFDRAVAGLAEELHAVILLIGLEDMSYQQTAQVLEIPVGTVMSRLSRAREKLRLAMDGNMKPSLRSLK